MKSSNDQRLSELYQFAIENNESGNNTLAIGYLQQALMLAEHLPVLHFFLGICYEDIAVDYSPDITLHLNVKRRF